MTSTTPTIFLFGIITMLMNFRRLSTGPTARYRWKSRKNIASRIGFSTHWMKGSMPGYPCLVDDVGMPKSVKPNRVSRWMERKNYEACLTIARTYYRYKERGRRVPIFKLSFLAAIIQRCLLIFLLLFRFNRNSYV